MFIIIHIKNNNKYNNDITNNIKVKRKTINILEMDEL